MLSYLFVRAMVCLLSLAAPHTTKERADIAAAQNI